METICLLFVPQRLFTLITDVVRLWNIAVVPFRPHLPTTASRRLATLVIVGNRCQRVKSPLIERKVLSGLQIQPLCQRGYFRSPQQFRHYCFLSKKVIAYYIFPNATDSISFAELPINQYFFDTIERVSFYAWKRFEKKSSFGYIFKKMPRILLTFPK